MPSLGSYLPVAGGNLYLEVTGAGSPVVLIHGFGLDRRMWDDEAERLALRYLVVRYDLRGFGKSSLPTGPSSHESDLRAVLAHLGIGSAHLVGLSLGGAIAIDFALLHPEHVRSLVVVDSFITGYSWKNDGDIMRAPWRIGRLQGIEAARASCLASPLFAPALTMPRTARRLREMVADYSGWHWVNDDPHQPPDAPAITRLQDVRAETLILIGELDLADFHDIAKRLEREVPRARRLVLPGVGHMSNLEAPDAFADTLATFLDGIGQSTSPQSPA